MLFAPQSKKKKKLIPKLKTPLVEYSEDILTVIETGIILVQSNDPLSRLIQYITRQEYSLVSIYKKYDNSDNIEIELLNILRSVTPYWLRNYKK